MPFIVYQAPPMQLQTTTTVITAHPLPTKDLDYFKMIVNAKSQKSKGTLEVS
jgi:hypothetical protein